MTGVELAGCAKNAAVLAAAAAAAAGPNVAGAAAGKVFAEVDALARARGGRPETFAGLAGAGDLVATVVAGELAQPPRRRAAGAGRARRRRSAPALGQAAEAVDSVPLLAEAAREAQPRHARRSTASPRSSRAGSSPSSWAATVTEPARRERHALCPRGVSRR